MSFKTWYNTNKAGWDSSESIQESVTARSNSYSTRNGFPLDFRTLRQTYAQALQLGSGARYPGLKVYILNENKEYIFKLTDQETLAMDNIGTLKEYHPELSHFYAATEEGPVPSDSNTLKESLGDSITVNNGTTNTTYNTIPEGAEGTYKTTDGKYYKFVWNGSEWVTYANTGSGSQSTPAVESIVNFNAATDGIGSINEITSAAITAKYGTTPADGAETNVVFTDGSRKTCRRYVYLGGKWYITRGTQEYTLTLPAYTSWDAWNAETVTCPSGVSIYKSGTEGFVNVYISHQFDSQFVDAFVFTTGSEDLDGDEAADSFGERILASATCFTSSIDDAFKVKIPLPISKDTTTSYAITLQK